MFNVGTAENLNSKGSMSIEVVGVNQSWTQPSTLLPTSSASPATSSTPPTLATSSPSTSPTSAPAINIAVTDDSGSPTPREASCTTTIGEASAEHPSDPPLLESSDSSVTTITTTKSETSTNDEVCQGGLSEESELSPDTDVAQQLSVTLPPLPDLIPIRKAQNQLQGIETHNLTSCSGNQQSPHATSSSSQILSLSSKDPVEEEAEGGDELEEEERDDEEDRDEEDANDLQHSTFEEATSTSIATSAGLDNQTIMYHDGNSMSQQHSTASQDQLLTPVTDAFATAASKKRGKKIKTEIEDPELCPIPHRKSDRRRVARDIFLVFEEHPANRRRAKGGKTKQQKNRPKSKFAHLMTETKKQKKAARSVPPVRIKSEPKTPTTPSARKPAPAATVASTAATATAASAPRVNPIFLWVKQDDTRIVEVRCEDYDKRNRIRLTKTANGWRAIPRTDPSSSRVAKLLPNPVVKIKQEHIEEAMRNSEAASITSPPPSSPATSHSSPAHAVAEPEVAPPIEPLKPLKILQPSDALQSDMESGNSHSAKKKKKKKKKKKRKHCEVHEEEPKKHTEEEAYPPAIIENPIISTEPNHLVYESTNHEREDAEEEEEDEDEDDENEEEAVATMTEAVTETVAARVEEEQPNIMCEIKQQEEEEDDTVNEEENRGDLVQHMEPNNNEPTEELSKNLTQISDDLELEHIPQFMQDVNPSAMQLCPETGLFIQKTSPVEMEEEQEPEHEPELNQEPIHHEDHVNPVVLSDSFDGSDVDTKNLKDLLDDADLFQHCTDNAMSGAELLDSLVKQGCEDNHISGDEPSMKDTICLDDFENEEDDVLMQPEPVADIISRLGGSLTASPKCLSFNEAGEIEGLHGELFQSTTQHDPFNRHTLDELSITIKDLGKAAEESYSSPVKPKSAETVTIVSPDSCVDEMPKDLTCKKSIVEKEKLQPTPLERPNSRSSDAIQSPQPSGLPAVPPSPDLVHSKSKNVFLEQLLNSSNSISPKICSSVTVTPIKIPNAPTKLQKEPLDLGKHRKSASPTVSCSEEAKRGQTVTIDDDSPDEPLHKRIKREENEDDTSEKTHTENLIEMLSSGKDPDPLTQLRLLIRNPEWKVPDPILVPKDRLSAVLASPAREIPLLLTTRPELRLPEAFAYPAILQDPDILVISMAQLETILQKQVEMTRPKAKTPPIPQVTIEAIPNPAKTRISEKPVCTPSPDITVSSKKSAPTSTSLPQQSKNFMNPLMGDIDAATLAAFNQMLWLPYLGQMAPEFIKAMAGLQNVNSIADLLPLLQQQQSAIQQQHPTQQQQNQKTAFPAPQFNPMAAAAAAAAGLTNPMAAAAAFQNPLELAMWQEALTQAQMQRMLKLNAAAALAAQQQQRESAKKSVNTDAKTASRSHYNMANTSAKQTPSNPPPPYHHSQPSQSNQRHLTALEKANSASTRSVPNPFYRPPAGSTESQSAHRAKQKTQQQQPLQQHQDQKPRVTCKSLSNLLQPERLSDAKMSNLMAMPGFDFGFNSGASTTPTAAGSNPFQFASAAAAAAAAASAGRSSGVGQFGGVGGSNGNHAAALHRNNHTASNINSNMTASQQHQHHQQHLQQQQQQQQQHHQQQHQQQQQSKLKVKPGSHLIDPAALQRRLLNCEDMSEVGSTTNGLEEMMADPNAALWHPLFGNTQKAGYNSPWQWTTVTASGE